MRKAIVAGQFYENQKDALKNQIINSFINPFGPGRLPEIIKNETNVNKKSFVKKVGNSKNKKDEKKHVREEQIIYGAICPHAGYEFSGFAAAHVYKKIAEANNVDTFVLLGLSHAGNNSAISIEDWQTPFGVIKNDKALSKAIAKKAGILIDEEVHEHEHSIEVQVPFIQFIKPGVKIVPIIVEGMDDCGKIAEAINSCVSKLDRTVMVIASSDFTHFGISYGYMPFSIDVKNKLKDLDNGAIEYIINLDENKFFEYVKEKRTTICGVWPIITLIKYLKLIGVKEGELLKYYTSGDILGDYKNAVGYGGIIFRKNSSE